MIVVMHVPYGGEVDIQPAGDHDCQLRVRCGDDAAELVIPDDLLRQLVAKASRHLDRRAAERTLAMLEAERERRCRAERPETLAVMAEVRVKEAAAEATAAGALTGKVG